MKGDFTRSRYRPEKRFSSVRMQQGRVWLDSDWNEQIEIQTHLERVEARDVIGCCGVPKYGGGFKIATTTTNGQPDLMIEPGRIYVGGTLVELVSEIRYRAQPDFPLPPGSDLTVGQNYLVYLDVWQRHMNALEDPDIREVALGGPDTTTRTRTIAQVRVLALENADVSPTCADFERCWAPESAASSARLRARTDPAATEPNPCIVPEQGGYRRLENQLYRIEIQRGSAAGTPTFKWSRDNGSVSYQVESIDAAQRQLKLTRPGRDSYLLLRRGDWVELVDDIVTLSGGPGQLFEVDAVDDSGTLITLTSAPPTSLDVDTAAQSHTFLRRWDHRAPEGGTLTDGALLVQEGAWIDIEDGVQIEFAAGGVYQVGDYWTIPARTAINDISGDVLWPRAGTTPRFEARHGIEHDYCVLALLTTSGDSWTVSDCRPIFPPLTEVDGEGCCCVRVVPGDDVRQAIDSVLAAGGGTVCLCAGLHTVTGELRLSNARGLTITGEGAATVLRLASEGASDGIVLAGCAEITIENMVVVGVGARSLIAVYPGVNGSSSAITLHGLTLLNPGRTRGDNTLDLVSAVRLADAYAVYIVACRMAAPFGIVTLNGEQLPVPADVGETPGGQRVVTFEDLEQGSEFQVGTVLQSGGIVATVRGFRFANGDLFEDGQARVVSGARLGLAGAALELNNVTLEYTFSANPPNEAVIPFAYGGGTLNLSINGELVTANNPTQLDGQVIGGVTVAVEFAQPNNDRRGAIRLSGTINTVAFGGQEFWVDNLTFGAPATLEPADYGDGVRDMLLRDSVIRYYDGGVLTFKAKHWLIEGCDIGSTRTTAPDDWPGTLPTIAAYIAALFDNTPPVGNGMGLVALFWCDCTIRASRIQGDAACFALFWLGGGVFASEVHFREIGLAAGWLHESVWDGNDVEVIASEDEGQAVRPRAFRAAAPFAHIGRFDRVSAGVNIRSSSTSIAFGLGGSYRARITNNRVRCVNGVANLPVEMLGDALDFLINTFGAAYTNTAGDDLQTRRAIVWVLLEELVTLTGLGTVRDRAQQLAADVLNTSLPVLLLLAHQLTRRTSEQGTFRLPFNLPQIAPVVHGNDIEALRFCVVFDAFVPLGGLAITHNRLHAPTGQALRLNAAEFATNVQLVIAFARMIGPLLNTLLERTAAQLANTDLPPSVVENTIALLNAIRTVIARWLALAESIFEADHRVESNSIRSRYDAVESNIYELAIITNHVTLHEQPVANSDTRRIVAELAESAEFAPVALAMRRGDASAIGSYSARLAEDAALLNDDQRRRDAAEAAMRVSANVDDVAVRERATRLGTAISARDNEALRTELAAFAAVLQTTISSYAVRVRGVGCRIVGNQLLVAPDTNADTWARGGVRVGLDGGSVSLLSALMQVAGGERELLGMTEMLVADNEIIGGAGHGVESRGDGGERSLLFGLTVRNNQVRGLAGAGVLVDEIVLAVGITIEQNVIVNCSSYAAMTSLSDAVGGIVARNVAFCQVCGNQITACSSGPTPINVWGVDLDTVYAATLDNNSVIHNGSSQLTLDTINANGGIRMERLEGEINLRNNQILLNRGLALLIDGAERAVFGDRDSDGERTALGAQRRALIQLYLRQRDAARLAPEQQARLALVQGNQIQTLALASVPGVVIARLERVNFTANSITIAPLDLGE